MCIWTVDDSNIFIVEAAYYRLTDNVEADDDLVIVTWFFKLTDSERAQIMYGEWDANYPETE